MTEMITSSLYQTMCKKMFIAQTRIEAEVLHSRQREGLRVLKRLYKERVIRSAASGETQETKVLSKEIRVFIRD